VLRVTDVLAHRPELTLEESFLRRRNMASNDTAQQPASTPSSPSKSSPHANHMPSFVYASNLTPTSRRLVTQRRARAPKQSINKTSSTLGADAYAADTFTKEDLQMVERGRVELTLELAQIGVSLIDASPQELCFVSIDGVVLNYTDSVFEQTIEVRVRDVQADNQMIGAPEAVLLRQARFDPSSDVIHFTGVRSQQHTKILFIRYMSILLRELEINVDELFGVAAVNLLQRYAAPSSAPYTNTASRANKPHESAQSAVASRPPLAAYSSANREWSASTDTSGVVYIQLLHINPVRVYVSFKTAGGMWRAAAEKSHTATLSGPSIGATLLTAVSVGANVDHAPLKLNALLLKNAFSSQSDLISRIMAHYTYQVVSGIFYILGSVDIIGNPVSLVNTLGTGVYDFFYEPVQGLVSSPQDFGIGLAKGTSSLVRHTVYGLFDTASKISGSFGQGAAYLSGDRAYVHQRQQRVAQQPTNIGDGLYMGLRELGAGIYTGARGVYAAPIKGARQDGASGLIRGTLRGVIGAAVKPAVGLLDFASLVAKGVKSQIFQDRAGGRARRRRLPRHFGIDGRLDSYSMKSALGRWLLANGGSGGSKSDDDNNGRRLLPLSFRGDTYVHHVSMKSGGVLLLSNRRLVKIDVDALRVLWQVPLRDIVAVYGVQRVSNVGTDGATSTATTTTTGDAVVVRGGDSSGTSSSSAMNERSLLLQSSSAHVSVMPGYNSNEFVLDPVTGNGSGGGGGGDKLRPVVARFYTQYSVNLHGKNGVVDSERVLQDNSDAVMSEHADDNYVDVDGAGNNAITRLLERETNASDVRQATKAAIEDRFVVSAPQSSSAANDNTSTGTNNTTTSTIATTSSTITTTTTTVTDVDSSDINSNQSTANNNNNNKNIEEDANDNDKSQQPQFKQSQLQKQSEQPEQQQQQQHFGLILHMRHYRYASDSVDSLRYGLLGANVSPPLVVRRDSEKQLLFGSDRAEMLTFYKFIVETIQFNRMCIS